MENKNLKLEDYNLDSSDTLKRVIKSDNREKIELEIGDAKQNIAYPQAKIMKWDNEVNFSIRRDNGCRKFKEKDNMIVFESEKEDVRFYELNGFEDGGLEVEILLKDKPKNNVFNFSIETKGLRFCYQGELSDIDEREREKIRPADVVGSYAVFHKTKKNNNLKDKHNYKTGKAFHIYRPKAIDNKGNITWCVLNIDVDKKILSVTVPNDFLDNASYPVVVDPTIGYTSIGASFVELVYMSTMDGNSATRMGTLYNDFAGGTVTKMSCALYSSTTLTCDYTVLINEKDSEGTDSHGELFKKLVEDEDVTTTTTWFHTDVDNVVIAAGDVILNIAGDMDNISVSEGNMRITFDSDEDYNAYREGGFNFTYPLDDPWNRAPTTITGLKDARISLYFTLEDSDTYKMFSVF